MKEYNELCMDLSTLVTYRYSTSFTKGIKTLHKRFHRPIFSIYGFVRLADEIVDTFHDHDKKELLEKLRADTLSAIKNRISTNPILHAFQITFHRYFMQKELIEAFLISMEMDLEKKSYDAEFYKKYIFGSAEAVGLMCLRVFCEGDHAMYDRLYEPARKLGSAFQKINFLRDLKSDYQERGRVYFPGVDFNEFNDSIKKQIEADIDRDFRSAYPGMMALPKDVRPGVYTTFIYYRELLKKIQKVPASKVMQTRVRVPDIEKFILLMRTYAKFGITG